LSLFWFLLVIPESRSDIRDPVFHFDGGNQNWIPGFLAPPSAAVLGRSPRHRRCSWRWSRN